MDPINLTKNRDRRWILVNVVINKIGGSSRRNGIKVWMFQRIVLPPSSGCKNSECLCFYTYANGMLSSEQISLSGSKLLGSTESGGFLDLLRDYTG